MRKKLAVSNDDNENSAMWFRPKELEAALQFVAYFYFDRPATKLPELF